MNNPGSLVEPVNRQEGEKGLPTGTVTFLFSDIQGSTALWEQMPKEMQSALAVHHDILRRAIVTNAGQVLGTKGDEFQAVFRIAQQGLEAALDAQRELRSATWGATGPLRVRMGLHTGPAELDPKGDAPYAVSHTLNRASRVMSAAHGGQVLLSQEMKDLVERGLPAGVTLKDLGEHRLKNLRTPEHLYQVCAPDLPFEFPPLPTAIVRPNNLPVEITTFIGREAEIQAVTGLLDKHRLVTLTGSGGTGKTRLSLRVAEEMLDLFPDGVWFVDLSPLPSPERLAATVAGVLGLQESAEMPIHEILFGYLKSRRLLVVLDNCEHLIAACAELAAGLLRDCPELTLLATSREALRVAGEYAFRVPSLSAPDPSSLPPINELSQYEAMQLFVERAAAVRHDFHLNDKNAAAVAQICRRVDGIPLAIELAAARVGVLSPQQISDRLNHAFHLLTGGVRTALPRQQTLRASIDWSYQLLDEKERLLLNRLSVFAGGWTLEAAEATCGFDPIADWEVLDLTASLVDKSLLVAKPEEGSVVPGSSTCGSQARYHMLDTLRQFAAEKLAGSEPSLGAAEPGEETVARDRHLAYYVRLVEQAREGLLGREQIGWNRCLVAEIENIRAARDWALGSTPPRHLSAGVSLLNAIDIFWYYSGFAKEILAWCEDCLAYSNELPNPDPLALGRLYYTGSTLFFTIMDYQKAVEYTEKALQFFRRTETSATLADALAWLGFLLSFSEATQQRACETAAEGAAIARQAGDPNRLSTILFYQGMALQHVDVSAARAAFKECIELGEKHGNILGIANAWRVLGSLAIQDGDFNEARACLQNSLAYDRLSSSKAQMTWDLSALGDLAYFEGQLEPMEAYFQQSIALAEETGQRGIVVWSHHHLGVAARRQGREQQALQYFRKSYDLAVEYRLTDLLLENISGLAGIALDQGDIGRAARLLGLVDREGRSQMGPIAQAEFARDEAEAREQLGEERFQAVWQAGHEMRMETAAEWIFRQAPSTTPLNILPERAPKPPGQPPRPA